MWCCHTCWGHTRTPTPENDVATQQNVYVPNVTCRNPSREAKHQQELLKDYFNHVRALTGQEDRISDMSTDHPGGRSWRLSVLFGQISVLFRTNQMFQELLFQLVLIELPTNLKTSSILFRTNFKNTSNQIQNPLFKKTQPKLCLNIEHPLNYFLVNLADTFEFKNLQNLLGEVEMFSKGLKVTRSNPNVNSNSSELL